MLENVLQNIIGYGVSFILGAMSAYIYISIFGQPTKKDDGAQS